MKEFDLADVLTITTGRLVSPRAMSAVYDVLNYLTQDDLFTHQLVRAAEHCRPLVIEQHPDLANIEVPEFEGELDERQAACIAWTDELKQTYGETRALAPVSGWEHVDPIAEAVDMVGPERVVVVELPE